jgi:hypothetical protein
MKTPNKNFATVYTENGQQFVLAKGGWKIPDIVKTIVTDDCADDMATVEITLRCNIVGSADEAKAIYEAPKEWATFNPNQNGI